MTIKLGTYDFFAYFIPGGIVTSAILFLLVMHSGLTVDFGSMSIVEFLLVATLAYLLGYANDYLARKTWYRLFLRKDRRNLIRSALEDLNKANSTFQVSSEHTDWYLYLSFIRKQNPDAAQEIDKLNVQNIMLRNASFAILIFAIIFAVEFVSAGYFYLYGIGSLLCFGTSIILVRESIKFSMWFVRAIYKALVALVITPEQLPIRFVSEVKTTGRKQKS